MKYRTAFPILAVLFAVIAALGAGRAHSAEPAARKPVTVFFLRHAETAASTKTERDPALSKEGAERAEALARLLSKAGVTHFFASEYVRTQSTLAPLAHALEAEVVVIAAKENKRQMNVLRELPPGSVAVVAGHSNTTPALVRGVGGEIEGGVSFDHETYDRLIVVILPAGEGAETQTIEMRYGK